MTHRSIDNILGVVASVVTIFSIFSFTDIGDIWKIAISIIIVMIILLYIFLNGHPIKKRCTALLRLWTKAMMRGLWHQDDLDHEIVNRFKKTHNIKLKVSRGYNLFKKKNNPFYKCLNNLIVKDKTICVPCIKSQHIQGRASINVDRTVDEVNMGQIKDYIKKGLDTVVELYEKSRKPNNIIIKSKYYGEKDTKWRYYIFDDNIIYLAYYDNQSRGSEVEMYKIHKGNQSLCEPFQEHFKDTWTDEASIEAILYIKEYYGIKNNHLTECLNCEHKKICTELRKGCIDQMNAIDVRMGN